MSANCNILDKGNSKLFGDLLLAVAFQAHKDHPGVFQGGNFVECPHCLFHVHIDSNSGDRLWRHWGQEYDKSPILDLTDDRLK